jgi:hypothetical protein
MKSELTITLGSCPAGIWSPPLQLTPEPVLLTRAYVNSTVSMYTGFASFVFVHSYSVPITELEADWTEMSIYNENMAILNIY